MQSISKVTLKRDIFKCLYFYYTLVPLLLDHCQAFYLYIDIIACSSYFSVLSLLQFQITHCLECFAHQKKKLTKLKSFNLISPRLGVCVIVQLLFQICHFLLAGIRGGFCNPSNWEAGDWGWFEVGVTAAHDFTLNWCPHWAWHRYWCNVGTCCIKVV